MAALNATDGYSILLTPDTGGSTQMAASVPASEETGDGEQAGAVGVERGGKGGDQVTGFRNFASFQFQDTLIPH